MSGSIALLFAIVIAVAEVLPISGRGHSVALSLAFDQLPDAPLMAAAHAAAGVALLIAGRRRLRNAIAPRSRRDGVKPPWEVPGLSLALAVGLGGAAAFRWLARGVESTPIAVGLGLVATGIMLGSTSAAERADGDELSLRRGLLVGMAQALAALPGGSTLGAGIAALLWTGTRTRRAVETSCVLTAGHEIFLAVHALAEPGARARFFERPGLWMLALVVATVAGILAAGRLPKVAERRLSRFGAYAAVLGLGLFAYGWSLH